MNDGWQLFMSSYNNVWLRMAIQFLFMQNFAFANSRLSKWMEMKQIVINLSE